MGDIMSNLSIIKKQRNEISKIMTNKRLSYDKANLLQDLFLKVLIEECKNYSNKLVFKKESKILLNHCLDNLKKSIDQIKNNEFINSSMLIRTVYEDFICIACIEHKEDFDFNLNLRTNETSSFVTDNSYVLFGEIDFDYYKSCNSGKDIHEFIYFYEQISKIIHPTPLKILTLELQNDNKISKYYSNLFKENVWYIILTVLLYLENRINPTKEELNFHNEMIKTIVPIHFINLIYFCSYINDKTISRYKNLFSDDRDKKFIENINLNAKKNKDILKNITSNEAFKKLDGKSIEDMLKEKGYYDIFEVEIKSIVPKEF